MHLFIDLRCTKKKSRETMSFTVKFSYFPQQNAQELKNKNGFWSVFRSLIDWFTIFPQRISNCGNHRIHWLMLLLLLPPQKKIATERTFQPSNIFLIHACLFFLSMKDADKKCSFFVHHLLNRFEWWVLCTHRILNCILHQYFVWIIQIIVIMYKWMTHSWLSGQWTRIIHSP